MAVKIDARGARAALERLRTLTSREVLVGIPAANNTRPGSKVGNAVIGYIMEFGSEAQHIPARPFLIPGVKAVLPAATKLLEKAAQDALAGDDPLHGMKAAGQLAENSVKDRMDLGIGPALAESTLEKRASGGDSGARQELARRATGAAPGMDLVKPLINTRQLRDAVTHVIAPKQR